MKTAHLFAALLCLCAMTSTARARDGVDVGDNSFLSKLVPAQEVEQAAAQQYATMLIIQEIIMLLKSLFVVNGLCCMRTTLFSRGIIWL